MLGLRRDELDELERAARLHDLGKIAVPDEILHKPGPLDEREWEFVRQHTIVGERILRASPALRSVAGIVRSSHENWDGSGYPDGLAGEEVAARIADHPRLQRLRGDDLGASVPARALRGGGPRRAHATRRHGVRRDDRARVRRSRPRRARSRAGGVARHGHTERPRPRSSVDRAADFESAGGGSTPPGAVHEALLIAPSSTEGGHRVGRGQHELRGHQPRALDECGNERMVAAGRASGQGV